MARSGNYSSGFVGEMKRRCEQCGKRRDCMRKKLSRTPLWLCEDCIINGQEYSGRSNSSDTPHATNGSPNEGKPVRGMGSPSQHKVEKVERDWRGRPKRS